ncbi:MAG: hypothetical protein C5B54_05765 [Acidobacteria bacterium]|nr:MAG: hypothetical protein C5B54_05765 [Acidobacteriota bacterium]
MDDTKQPIHVWPVTIVTLSVLVIVWLGGSILLQLGPRLLPSGAWKVGSGVLEVNCYEVSFETHPPHLSDPPGCYRTVNEAQHAAGHAIINGMSQFMRTTITEIDRQHPGTVSEDR